jgi:hypothetical protein
MITESPSERDVALVQTTHTAGVYVDPDDHAGSLRGLRSGRRRRPATRIRPRRTEPGIVHGRRVLFADPGTHQGTRSPVCGDDRASASVDVDGGEHNHTWQQNALRGAAVGTSTHGVSTSGVVILAIDALDPGLIIDRIVLRSDEKTGTYLGPRETNICE